MIKNNKFILKWCVPCFCIFSSLFYLNKASANLSDSSYLNKTSATSYLAHLNKSSTDFSYPPVSVLVNGKPQTYIKKEIDPQVLASVLSPRQIKEHTYNIVKMEEERKLFQLFYNWFIKELPYEIEKSKLHINKTDRVQLLYERFTEQPPYEIEDKLHINKSDQVKSLFVRDIGEGPLVAKNTSLHWTQPEKLNVFLFYLHQNVPEEELLNLLKEWNLNRYPNVYIMEYHRYMDKFFQSEGFKTFKKGHKEALNLFHKKRKTLLTSLLHEVIKKDKKQLFNELINSPYGQGNINIQNYMEQTPLHTAMDQGRGKRMYYIKALLQQKGIKINVADFRGWRPISYLVKHSDSIHFVDLRHLLKLTTPDMQFLDKTGRTLPLLAVEMDKPKLAQFLYEQGAPFPKKVSLLNTYMTSDYNKIKFQYQTIIKIDRIVDFFNKKTFIYLNRKMRRQFSNSKVNKQMYVHNTLSLENFQPDIINSVLTDKWESFKDWEKFRNQVFQYDFLWHRLKEFSVYEENLRRVFITSALFDDSDKKIGFKWRKKEQLNSSAVRTKKIIQAIYRGDVSQLNKLLLYKEKIDPSVFKPVLSKDINAPLLKEWYKWPKNYMSQVSVFEKIYQLQLPNNIRVLKEAPLFKERYGFSLKAENIPSGPSLQKIIHDNKEVIFYTEISSLLSEAIRANQLEVVQFLLGLGANPIYERNNFVIKNDLVTALLGKEIWRHNPEDFERHLSIVDMLLNHRSVTKEFLNQEVIPGTQINYVDLAALKGSSSVVKKMYKKGARVTSNFIWNRSILIEDVLLHNNFKKTAHFIVEQKLEKITSKSEVQQEKTRECKKAFNSKK